MVLVRVLSESAEEGESDGKEAKMLLKTAELQGYEHVGSGKFGNLHSVDLMPKSQLSGAKKSSVS